MSFTAEAWAWDQTCPNGVAKSVLARLGFMAGRGNGECYPSIEAIAKATQHTERAVRKAIDELIKAKLLTREERRTKAGRITSPTYKLSVSSVETCPEIETPALAKTPPLNGSSALAKTPPLEALRGGENALPGVAKTPPEPFLEPKQERKAREKDSHWEASQPARQPEPEPAVVVDREAQAAEHAATLAALKPPLAFALSSLAASLSGIAYAPGRSPRLTPEEMRDALKPKRQPARASPEEVAAIRALSAQRGRTYIPMGASP